MSYVYDPLATNPQSVYAEVTRLMAYDNSEYLAMTVANGLLRTGLSYSTAIRRMSYAHNSVQATSPMTVQISLVDTPNMDNDDDWVAVNDTVQKYVHFWRPTVWLRCKFEKPVTETDALYIAGSDRTFGN